jgi:sec-independent protein translocase protein TatA
MFGNTIGPAEIGIVLLIALVIFGPKKLPELGKGLGRGMRDFKRAVSGDDEVERKVEEAAVKVVPAPEPVVTIVEIPEPVVVGVAVEPAASAADDRR